ncbi:MAG: metallophosphoesterase [Pirellulales bacterium]|nr:metallophosphoesterase [Pirellulales bacterium]
MSSIARREFLQRVLKGTLLGASAGLGYAYGFEPHWIEVVERSLPIDRLPEPLVGRRLVQLSDLHVGDAVNRDYITSAVTSVADLEPDLIVITGDFMTCDENEQLNQVEEVLSRLPAAPLGRFGILGNHDYGRTHNRPVPARELTQAMENLGIRMLRNEVADTNGLQIAGVDDLLAGYCLPSPTLAELDLSRAALMLCHNPDAMDHPIWLEYRGWILSGHTHGGQCRLPWLGPPVIPVRNRRYTSGEIRLTGDRHLYINRGLGHTHRIRFNCRPEITVFTLQRNGTAAPHV